MDKNLDYARDVIQAARDYISDFKDDIITLEENGEKVSMKLILESRTEGSEFYMKINPEILKRISE